MFKNFSDRSISDVQKEQIKQWDDENLLEKCITTREDGPSFIFYDGPPTANGKPGIHHVISRTLKDTVCRYKTMKGYKVKRKAGWDTHGLPVEIEVEKTLNLESKQDIEAYGIENFNQKCKDSVFTYEKQWREMTKRMGYLIDLDDPYITLENDYIESVWWILNKFFKEDFLYEGHNIMPYCPRCGTGLASHEVALGYKEVKTNTVVAAFKRKDVEEYFLAWTTTPWTLAANVSLTVNPKVTYIKVKAQDHIYYVAEDLAAKVIGEDYEVLETMTGKDLEYVEYEQLMPFVKVDKKAFFITCNDYVTTADGTGIVHTAPAFGEDDYKTGRKYDLPVPNPVGEDGKYLTTPWEGRDVMDCDVDIIKWLHGEGKLFSKEKMTHNYPHCWRCSTPLLYYSKPGWYIQMTKIKDLLIENNKGVNWYPDYVGEKRFGNWLENLNDWAISRNRYWGTPLNIWRCSCGHIDSVGSRQELADKAIEDINSDIELHRPYVDDVHIKCDKCGESMARVPEVIDCWFDSGAMPFAQQHYPFENKEKFEEEMFPADYICEGIDQTRGWFYSLLAIGSFVMGKSPYKNVLVNDLILDKEGKKMSKSKGNTADPFALFDQYGADATRWYLLHVSPAWSPTKFDEDGLKEVQSKFFGTLKNVYNFFVLYSNTDGIDPKSFDIPKEDRPELDRWIMSKYNSMLKVVNEEMEAYDLMKAVRAIYHFVDEELSNWYIRRARRRFWATDLDNDKKSVFNTTYEILVGLSKVIAPYAPFISDEMYKNLVGEESVHLADFPEAEEAYIDLEVEEKMDLVRSLVGLGRSAREQERIKVRQPLQKIMVDGKYEAQIADMVLLIKEELNVKEVVFEKDLDTFMNYSLKPDFKAAGPILGKNVKLLAKGLAKVDAKQVIADLDNGKEVVIDVDENAIQLQKDFLMTQISAKDGFTVTMENNLFTILDTNISEELVSEGLAREFVSKVQQMRKNSGFEVLDQINIIFNGADEVEKAITTHQAYIKDETLAVNITISSDAQDKQDLNGREAFISVEKI